MTRRLAAMTICAVLALATGACAGGGAGDHGAQRNGKTTVGTGAATEQPQAASLALPIGRSSVPDYGAISRAVRLRRHRPLRRPPTPNAAC